MSRSHAPRKAAGKKRGGAARSAGRGFSARSFGIGTLFGAALALMLVYGPDLVPTFGAKASADAAASEPVTPGLTYQFMDLLPNEEVVTGVAPFNAPERASSPAAVVAPSAPAQGAGELARSDPNTNEYLLQAGSFSNRDEADAMRAELLLEGMSVVVSAVPSSSGGVWHRVMVGPFSTQAEMERNRTSLRSRDISALPVAYSPTP